MNIIKTDRAITSEENWETLKKLQISLFYCMVLYNASMTGAEFSYYVMSSKNWSMEANYYSGIIVT